MGNPCNRNFRMVRNHCSTVSAIIVEHWLFYIVATVLTVYFPEESN